MSGQDDFLTPNEAVKFLTRDLNKSASRDQILRLMEQGDLPAINTNPGGQPRWVLRRTDVLRLGAQLPDLTEDEYFSPNAAVRVIQERTGKTVSRRLLSNLIAEGELPAKNASPSGQPRWLLSLETILRFAATLPEDGLRPGPKGRQQPDEAHDPQRR